jgi:hypothetical protein
MMDMTEILAAALGFLITCAIFSYILGDNPLLRLALHVLAGAAAGYTALVVFNTTIKAQIYEPYMHGSTEERLLLGVPIILGVLLLAKLVPPLSSRLIWAGNPSLAFLSGVGAAVAVGGAVTGTILPQIWASVNVLDPQAVMETARSSPWSLVEMVGNAVIILLGTLTTLIAFHFGARSGQTPQRPAWINTLAQIGQGFIAITLGVLFAGVLLAALPAMIERCQSALEFIYMLLGLVIR